MGKSAARGAKTPPPSKKAQRPHKPVRPKALKPVQRGESESVSGNTSPKQVTKATVDRRYFGTPGAGATHILLTKHSANGSAERCFVNRNGVAEERLPIEYASVERLRRLWGPGTYRGQWLALDHGKWRPLGRTAEVRILPHTAEESVVRPASRAIGDVVASDGGEVAPSRALAVRESDEVIDMRLRAEREIAKMRLDAEREISETRFNLRLDELRAENEAALRRLEERIDEGSDDDDREPSPWDWIMPLLEKLRPTIEQLAPQLLSKLVQKAG
jgi:hypothetical protein